MPDPIAPNTPPNPTTPPASIPVSTDSLMVNPGGTRLSMETIAEETRSNTKNLEKFEERLNNERLNSITIFGIFASLVTFLSVEIQIFKTIENFWLLIGLTSFLVSSLLLFVFSVHAIARDRLRFKDFFVNPIFWIFLLFLFFSFTIFFLNAKGINVDLQIKSHDQVETKYGRYPIYWTGSMKSCKISP